MTRMRMPADPEVQAVNACVRALEPLDLDARDRTMEYLSRRYGAAAKVLIGLCEANTELTNKVAELTVQLAALDAEGVKTEEDE